MNKYGIEKGHFHNVYPRIVISDLAKEINIELVGMEIDSRRFFDSLTTGSAAEQLSDHLVCDIFNSHIKAQPGVLLITSGHGPYP